MPKTQGIPRYKIGTPRTPKAFGTPLIPVDLEIGTLGTLTPEIPGKLRMQSHIQG